MQKITLKESQLNRVIYESAIRLIRSGMLNEAPSGAPKKRRITPDVRKKAPKDGNGDNADKYIQSLEPIINKQRQIFVDKYCPKAFKSLGVEIIKRIEEGESDVEIFRDLKQFVTNEKHLWAKGYIPFISKVYDLWGNLFHDIVKHPENYL